MTNIYESCSSVPRWARQRLRTVSGRGAREATQELKRKGPGLG